MKQERERRRQRERGLIRVINSECKVKHSRTPSLRPERLHLIVKFRNFSRDNYIMFPPPCTVKRLLSWQQGGNTSSVDQGWRITRIYWTLRRKALENITIRRRQYVSQCTKRHIRGRDSQTYTPYAVLSYLCFCKSNILHINKTGMKI